ncbi:MAG: hypothetical protein BWZ02_02870 [Lentisphaerae bacterium ADurb.BinA184]|nr:MAG: hypothetical protein BWZ02_02870 [Lentisphaerae bacterium ADurb.BinA184]
MTSSVPPSLTRAHLSPVVLSVPPSITKVPPLTQNAGPLSGLPPTSVTSVVPLACRSVPPTALSEENTFDAVAPGSSASVPVPVFSQMPTFVTVAERTAFMPAPTLASPCISSGPPLTVYPSAVNVRLPSVTGSAVIVLGPSEPKTALLADPFTHTVPVPVQFASAVFHSALVSPVHV